MTPAALFLAALAWHLGWAAIQGAPRDADSAYYLGVARHIVAGDGAVTDAVRNLAWLPPSLVHPADLQSMPGQSRWLVPFLFLPMDPWRAAQVASAIAAAAWAPLAWAWACRWGRPDLATWAGLAAGLGGVYLHSASRPDATVLYGTVGGAALYFASMGRAGPAATWAAVAALTRGDGLLLSIACAFGPFPTLRSRIVVALAGPLAAAFWAHRATLLIGDGASRLAWRATNSVDATELLLADEPARLDIPARVAFLVEHLDDIGRTALIATGFFLGPLALIGGWRRPGTAVLAAYALVFPPTVWLLVPATHWTDLTNSAAALFPAVAALAILGAARIAATLSAPERAPDRLAGVGVVVGLALVTVVVAPRAPAGPETDCPALESARAPPGAPLLSHDPFGTATRCGHPSLILARATKPVDVALLADQYGIDWAIVAPVSSSAPTLGATDLNLHGWRRVGDRVWTRSP